MVAVVGYQDQLGPPVLGSARFALDDRRPDSLAAFAVSYADQNDRDFESFLQAIRSGRIPAEPGR